MKHEDQVCGLELAKRLDELGVRGESFFQWEIRMGKPSLMWRDHHVQDTYIDTADLKQYFPAFTAVELGEMLPSALAYEDTRGQKVIGILKERFYVGGTANDKGERYFELGFFAESNVIDFRHCETSEADVRANMLIYLIEHKFLDPVKLNQLI